jgi:hypothetical protein
MQMYADDPYGLPTFHREATLEGWTDHSLIQMRDVRIFTKGTVTVTLIHHPGLWDFIVSDGHGNVECLTPQTEEISALMDAI